MVLHQNHISILCGLALIVLLNLTNRSKRRAVLEFCFYQGLEALLGFR